MLELLVPVAGDRRDGIPEAIRINGSKVEPRIAVFLWRTRPPVLGRHSYRRTAATG